MTIDHSVVPNGSVHMEEISIKKGATVSHQDQEQQSLCLGERIKNSKSILTLTNLISPTEIQFLVESSLAVARRQKMSNDGSGTFELLDDGVPGNAYVRLSTMSAAKRENRCTESDALPEPISEKLEEVLMRTFQFLDQELCPSFKASLFGFDTTLTSTTTSTNDDPATISTTPSSTSLKELFQNNQLQFSIREPAINIYQAPHGHFGMHKDNNDLTILMPLSTPDEDFLGGGTAFWSQSYPVQGMHDPSLIVTPQAGTAILFGGKVSHKAMHIKSGTRLVFVASFSRPSYGKERDRGSSWRLE